MSFPSPPWALHGQVWVSLFYASRSDAAPGVHAAAYLIGERDSTVPHRALVVAERTRDEEGRAYRVIDGWADTASAVEGLGALFAMGVHDGNLTVELGGLGPVARAEWNVAGVGGALFADTAGVALRTPLKVVTRQPRADGASITATLSGSGRTVPCLATWTLAAEGPLGWLARKQPFASFRVRDARLVLS